MIKYYQLQR